MEPRLPDPFFWDRDLRLGEETAQLTKLSWPNYLIEKSDIPDPALSFELTRQELARRFPAWGIRNKTNRKLVAYANAALIATDLSGSALSDRGWQFAIESAFSQEPRNCLCLLAANVDPESRNLGLSKSLLEYAKAMARDLGMHAMAGPVRPVLKSNFPHLPFEEYVAKRSANGEIFDPWLNLHVKCGGEILNICSNSVEIKATLSKWMEWTGLSLNETGEYTLPFGLAPLRVDLGANLGVYREPNVWVRYNL